MPQAERPARINWLLLALSAARDCSLTAVQLQKILFVFGERRGIGAEQYYSFQPYHYGPFDAEVYSDAEYLQSHGLLTIDASQGRSLRKYCLTPEGKAAASQLKEAPYAGSLGFMRKVVAWAQALSFNQLVRSVYEAFPEMRENSVFGKSV
jgi:hypothetical protein